MVGMHPPRYAGYYGHTWAGLLLTLTYIRRLVRRSAVSRPGGLLEPVDVHQHLLHLPVVRCIESAEVFTVAGLLAPLDISPFDNPVTDRICDGQVFQVPAQLNQPVVEKRLVLLDSILPVKRRPEKVGRRSARGVVRVEPKRGASDQNHSQQESG